MRRFLKFAILTLLILTLLLTSALYYYVRSDSFDRWLQQKIVTTLESRFKLRAEVGSVDFRLIGTQLEIRNFKIWDELYPKPAPVVSIERVLLDFSILHYILPSISLDRVILISPRIRIIKDPNLRLNLSNAFFSDVSEGGAASPLPVKIRLGLLRIQKGLILYETRPIEVETAEGGMRLDVRYEKSRQDYAGQVGMRRMNLKVAGFRLTNLETQFSFKFFRDRLSIVPLNMTSDQMNLHATGALEQLSSPRYRFDSDLTLALHRIKEPSFDKYFQKGDVRSIGVFQGQEGDFTYQGRLESDIVEFRHLPLHSLRARFVLNRDTVKVSSFKASYFQGSIQSEGDLGLHDEEPSRFKLSASGVEIYPLLSYYDQSRIRAGGTARLQASVRWPGLNWSGLKGSGTVRYEGSFFPPDRSATPASAIPYQGSASLRLHGNTVDLQEGALQTPHSMVHYTGPVTYEGGYDLKFETRSGLGNEMLRLSRYFELGPQDLLNEYQTDLPGPLQLDGRIEGEKATFRLKGTTRMQQIFLKGHPVGDFRSSLDMNNRWLRIDEGLLTGTDSSATISALIPLREDDPDLFPSYRFDFRRIPVEGYLFLFPQIAAKTALQGRVSGPLHLTFPSSGRVSGKGRLSIDSPGIFGQNLDRLRLQLEMGGSELNVSEFEGRLGKGTLTGSLQLNLEDRRYGVQIRGRALPLQDVQALNRQVNLSGPIDFQFRGRGDLDQLPFRFEASASQLTFNGYPLKDLQLHANGGRERASFSVEHTFMGNPFSSSGTVSLHAPFDLQATMQLQRTPVAPYLNLIPSQRLPKIDGNISGQIRISGPLADLKRLFLKADFSRLSLSSSGFDVENATAVKVSLQEGKLELEPARFKGPETEIQAGGSLGLEDGLPLDLRLNGKVNLRLFNNFVSSGALSGELSLSDTVLSGPLRNPRLVGNAELRNGFIFNPALPTTLFGAQGNFKFTADQVSVDDFSARTIYGRINARGGIFLEGLKPSRWKLNIFGSGLNLEYPKDMTSRLDVDLDFMKSDSSQLISGAVYVRSAEYAKEITLAELFTRYSRSEITPGPSLGNQEIVLDVSVEAYRTIRVKNNLADVVASGDFTVRGTVRNPVVLGSMTVDTGRLTLENNEYEIVRGNIAFNDPRRTRPEFNLEAETEVRDYTITILVHGPLERLKFSFRSDPPLPTSSVVSLLAVGQTEEEIFGPAGAGQGQVGTLAAYGAGALLSKSVGEKLEARTSRLFGFEKFSVDPFLFESGRNPGARITLGKQLTKDLTVTYSTDLGSGQAGQIVVIQYRVTPWLTAVGTRDLDGSIALDFKLRKRF